MKNRREFLKSSLLASILLTQTSQLYSSCSVSSNNLPNPDTNKGGDNNTSEKLIQTRAVTLAWNDVATLDWPYLAVQAGLNNISFYVNDSLMESETFHNIMKSCKSFNIDVEFEQHAMAEILPRTLFEKDPTMFRMDEEGNRINDYNCCASSVDGLSIISENARQRTLRQKSTTGRYFYWLDDGGKKCYCSKCKDLSFSDQSLLIENEIIKSIKTIDSSYTLSHLAYTDTIPAPTVIKPEPGIFLEFAPFQRRWDKPLSDREARRENMPLTHGEYMDHLDENLKVFPVETAHILEYWLDVSLFSGWEKPAVQLPWRPDVCKADIETYTQKGIKHIRTFAAYIDAEYVANHKDLSFINEYGEFLNKYIAKH